VNYGIGHGFSICMFAGITDDDLRETAYEILLACAGASGYAVSLGLACIILMRTVLIVRSILTT